MAQRIIQICDRCKVELNTSDHSRGPLQNYQFHHRTIIIVKNSYVDARGAGVEFDLCPDCEEKLFKFLKNELMVSK